VRVDRKRIAYLTQETPLLDDTIRSNLLFGLPDMGDAELTRALSAARLEEFVAAQPLGLETRIGDNGILFSGGERQRLGLARAILRGATLLLLDEATSALDEENERQVLDNLSTSGVAILLVTHRTHAQLLAQRHFHLREGCLVEEFPWQSPKIERMSFSGAV
jgi:subfamily B ATP-binding cassette protein MsbA